VGADAANPEFWGLCLAGATPWGRDRKPLQVPREPRVSRLVLYAPAAGWFAAPGALELVTVPVLVYAENWTPSRRLNRPSC
jgi:hypothetical protein